MRGFALFSLALGLSRAAESLVDETRDVVPMQELVERALEGRSLVDTIWNDIKNAATCTACEAVLLLLKGAAELGDTFFVDTLQEICKLSGAEDDDVCVGTIALEGPIIAHDLRGMSIGSHTSELFCITFLGLCPYPSVTPYTVPFPSAKPATSRPATSGQTPIKVVHYSDIHVDPFYVPGSNANCSKPICCRPYTTADSPGHASDPAGPNGDHQCDVPISLETSMYAAIKSIAPDAAFAVFTGDIVDHAIWNTTQPQNVIDINDAYSRMASSGLPYVYGTAGNHEASPANAFPPAKVGSQSQWVYNTLSADWSKWIGASATSSVLKFGAYSTRYPGGNLRVISINTNLFYIDNFWLYEEPMETDPSGQLAWLVGELDAAEKAGERVWIIGHTPPGETDAFHDGSNYIDQIVNRYSATIAAMFYGHTHRDHFEISYADYAHRSYSNALVTSYIMPSLTPTSGQPAFRVYSIDPVTFAVLDSTTYIADMTNPAFQTTGPVWTKYYSAKEAYGPLVSPPVTAASAELSPAFWHNVTAALAGSQAAFDAYYARKSRGYNVAACTGACVTQEVCKLQAGRSQDNCFVPSPGINFSKREAGEAVGHRDECGISVARSTIASMAVDKEMLRKLETRVVEKRAVVARA